MCLEATEGSFYPVPVHSILKDLGQSQEISCCWNSLFVLGLHAILVRKIFEVAKSFFPLFAILCLIKRFLLGAKATATEVFSSVILTSEGRTSVPFVLSLLPDFTPFLSMHDDGSAHIP